jgi:hypothetical protein
MKNEWLTEDDAQRAHEAFVRGRQGSRAIAAANMRSALPDLVPRASVLDRAALLGMVREALEKAKRSDCFAAGYRVAVSFLVHLACDLRDLGGAAAAEPSVPEMPEAREDGRNVVLLEPAAQSSDYSGFESIGSSPSQRNLSAAEIHDHLRAGWGVKSADARMWSHFHRTFPASRYAPQPATPAPEPLKPGDELQAVWTARDPETCERRMIWKRKGAPLAPGEDFARGMSGHVAECAIATEVTVHGGLPGEAIPPVEIAPAPEPDEWLNTTWSCPQCGKPALRSLTGEDEYLFKCKQGHRTKFLRGSSEPIKMPPAPEPSEAARPSANTDDLAVDQFTASNEAFALATMLCNLIGRVRPGQTHRLARALDAFKEAE